MNDVIHHLMKSPRSTPEETRLRIMTKADELFRQYGFGKTTVADIAQELGMSTANIYKFFSSKNAIVESCANRNLGIMQQKLTAIVQENSGAMDRIDRCILTIFRFHKELLQNERQIFKLVVSAIEEDWKCIQEFDKFLLETLTRLVHEGVKRKEFRPLDPAESALTLLDCLSISLHPHMHYKHIHDGSEKRVRAQLQFLAKALQ